MMWANLFKNVRNWTAQNLLPPAVLRLPSLWWLLIIGILLSTVVVLAILRPSRARLMSSPPDLLARGQHLFLLVTWIAVLGAFTQALPGMANRGVFLVHASFWITGGLASLIVVSLTPENAKATKVSTTAADVTWRPRRSFWICLLLMAIFVYAVARLTVASHAGPLPGSQVRFSRTISPN